MRCIRVFTTTNNTYLYSFISHRKSTGIVMGNASRKHFENISSHLLAFEREPKEINGNMLHKWFNIGENIFEEFYYLGTSFNWNCTQIKTYQVEVADIASKISKNQGWLQSFISLYPGFRIDLEGATPAVNVCRVRSGIEYLLEGFTNVDKNFNEVLNNLKALGDLQEFDEHLKVWTEGHRPDFFPGDQLATTPKSHWWWF